MIRVVNMIPSSLSGESHQDSEPNIAVNPENPTDIVATAFTPAPMGGPCAPIYVSTDGGDSWALRTVVPGNSEMGGTFDITVAFATRNGMLYAGTINGATKELNILRTANFNSSNPMEIVANRGDDDQPWVVAGSVVAGDGAHDRVFVGSNDLARHPQTATIDLSQDAATGPPPAGFATTQVERGPTIGQDAPAIRTVVHSDGTVYSAFERWNETSSPPNMSVDVVVVRDDNWGADAPPFAALGADGQSVARDRLMVWEATMGQERLGADLTIAVDPRSSDHVWVAWCDRVGGTAGTDWTLHVARSTDRGQTWSADLRTIANVKNPSLAINAAGLLGLFYQAFTGTHWISTLELTNDAWESAAETHILHQAPANTPTATFFPYLGDYVRMLAVGEDLYGVFCGNNTPDRANFPSGVIYQRNVNWETRQLLALDGATVVAPSIDPFFFHWSA